MNASSVDIKDMLEAESSLGLTFGTNLFIGLEYNTPDECVTIFDINSPGPIMTLTGEDDYNYDAVQIRIRGNTYQTGIDLAKNIVLYLHGKAQETWNNTLYSLIQCINNPALLDWDEKRRPRFIINFNIQRR